jgi:hypothetical protein
VHAKRYYGINLVGGSIGLPIGFWVRPAVIFSVKLRILYFQLSVKLEEFKGGFCLRRLQ